MIKPWYKDKNAGEWCIYYATTDDEGRTYKNFVCECCSEEEANQILSLQRTIFLCFKIACDNNDLDDVRNFLIKECGPQFLKEMETALEIWLEKNDKLP